MLLKGIPELQPVKTAWTDQSVTALRAECFDLVVSDVEMPRMNGFALTAKIRADKKLADLPVVLVTVGNTRGSGARHHAGANAYLVKQLRSSNLLETVRRLAERKDTE
jgi:two-component system chemotaxis sensor kinase CheA